MSQCTGFVQKLILSSGGQRFVMAIGSGIVNTALRVLDFISQEIYRDLIVATVGAFILAKTWESVTALRSPPESKVDPYA